jgi:hypothetical protein
MADEISKDKVLPESPPKKSNSVKGVMSPPSTRFIADPPRIVSRFVGPAPAKFEERNSALVEKLADILITYEGKCYDLNYLVSCLEDLSFIDPVKICASCRQRCQCDESISKEQFLLNPSMKCACGKLRYFLKDAVTLFNVSPRSIIEQLLLIKGFIESEEPNDLSLRIWIPDRYIRTYYGFLNDRVEQALFSRPPELHYKSHAAETPAAAYELSLRKVVCNYTSNIYFYVGGILQCETDQCIFETFSPEDSEFKNHFLHWAGSVLPKANETQIIAVDLGSDCLEQKDYVTFFTPATTIASGGFSSVGSESPNSNSISSPFSPTSSSQRSGAFQEGMKVEAKIKGEASFFPGRIKKHLGGGIFLVLFDGAGATEYQVKETDIRAASSLPSFHEGDKIEVNFRRKGKYLHGVIERKRADGDYDVRYEDSGEVEMKVRAADIRSISSSSAPLVSSTKARLTKPPSIVTPSTTNLVNLTTPSLFQEGQAIQAKWRGEGDYLPGTIRKVNGDGSYCVRYENGGQESKAKEENIRSLPGVGEKDSSSLSYSSSLLAVSPSSLAISPLSPQRRATRFEAVQITAETRVEVDWRGYAKYYSGKINQKNFDGTYYIHYDDGGEELRMKEENIRFLSHSSDSSSEYIQQRAAALSLLALSTPLSDSSSPMEPTTTAKAPEKFEIHFLENSPDFRLSLLYESLQRRYIKTAKHLQRVINDFNFRFDSERSFLELFNVQHEKLFLHKESGVNE